MRVNLSSLASSLPRTAERLATPEHRAVHLAPETVKGYVEPDLLIDDGFETDAAVVLIAAPGAMGKSEAAKYLANALNTIYVDLSQINVGEGSLLGELIKSLGPQGFSTFQDAVRRNQAALILDSTDEAQLRSGSENYFAFLKDLRWFIDEETPGTRIVLLGRSDSIDMTRLALELLELPTPVFTLQPLSALQASSFIDATLDAHGYELHRTQPEPSARLRQALMTNIARAMNIDQNPTDDLASSWNSVETFLGYPPVLLALSERLRVPNPQSDIANISKFDAPTVRRQRGELLREIVEAILDRESRKVREAVGESLGIRQDDPIYESLYSRSEQTSRLLSLTGTTNVTQEYPALLDASDRAKYEELVTTFVPDHPFVRGATFANQVFSDYVRAWAIASPVSQLLSIKRAAFLSSLPTVGPFFASFIPALTPRGSELTIPEDLVDDTIRSNAMGSKRAHAWYRHLGDSPATLRLFPDDNSEDQDTIELQVSEPSGVLVLSSPVSRLTVFSDYGVLLTTNSGEFDLGPDLVIVCGELDIRASAIRVAHSKLALGPSLLISQETTNHPNDLRVHSYASGDLLISWPTPWHQWSDFTLPQPSSSRIPYALATQVVVAVRKILRAFRSSMDDRPAVSADKVDRILVGNNEVAKSVLSALLDLSVIERASAQYRLDLHQLAAFGLSWQSLQADNPHEALGPFCEQIINVPSFRASQLDGA